MRLPPLLLNVLMLLAIVVNTIPAHAHVPAASMGATQGMAVEAARPASTADDAMPCHDEGASASEVTIAKTPLHHPAGDEPGGQPPAPCCDDTAGGCDCACLLQAVAVGAAVPRLPSAPPRTAPAGVQPAAAEPPTLASLIRPPIG